MTQTAKERFDEALGETEESPLERLRFFCSLAMNGQDWLDVEPFFDAISAPQTVRQDGEPTYGQLKIRLENALETVESQRVMLFDLRGRDRYSAADMADAQAKAAQVEREECARLCDSLTEGFAATTTWDSAVLNCSQHIRMRGKGF